MKKIITAIALTTVMASPVFAKSARYYDMAPTADVQTTFTRGSARAFEGPDYVGQDPDPSVRSELRRDPPSDR